MKIARFEPWSYVDLLHRDLNRSAPHQTAGQWTPAVDILEEQSQFVLRADVPGVRVEDIEVTMDAGVLTISGARDADKFGDDVNVRRTERASGSFSRRFTIPESTDAEKITARSNNGILEIAIPKLAEVQARQITVEAA